MVSSADQPHPSAEYLALVRTPPARLTGVLRRGDTPHVDALAGWEWRGTNMPATSRLLGLRRFIKGFTLVEDGRAAGYNVSVPGADLSSPWTPRNQCDGRREWASFTITTVDPTATDNRYLHALLLDLQRRRIARAGYRRTAARLPRPRCARLRRTTPRPRLHRGRPGTHPRRLVRPGTTRAMQSLIIGTSRHPQ